MNIHPVTSTENSNTVIAPSQHVLHRDYETRSTLELTIVEPSVWKRFHKLPGKEKEASRQRALQLFPEAHALLARRLDHGRAEAGLLALYGAQQ